MALDNDVIAGKITKRQRNTLWDGLGIYTTFRQESKKYEELSGAGLTPQDASSAIRAVSNLPDNAKGIDRWSAILAAGLSDQKEETAIRAYMTDAQEAKMDAAMSNGVSPELYVVAMELYNSTSGYGAGRSDYAAKKISESLGIDYDTAELLIEIYRGAYGK